MGFDGDTLFEAEAGEGGVEGAHIDGAVADAVLGEHLGRGRGHGTAQRVDDGGCGGAEFGEFALGGGKLFSEFNLAARVDAAAPRSSSQVRVRSSREVAASRRWASSDSLVSMGFLSWFV